jgi:metabolite-proton symporter
MSSFAGSAIEYYDFFIYGTAAALVFPTVFFPNLGTTMATAASLAMFAVAFFARPLGAAVFGHFGDRLGRKKTLIATMLIMGLSTVAVGLVPTTATIGLAAPLILLTLRVLQGFAVGGEWAGSALLSTEHAPTAKRGTYGMFTQVGMGSGLVMANLVFLAVHLMGDHSAAFMQWGWRIPFLGSAVLIVIALYTRLNIAETPVFTDEQARHATPRVPMVELIKGRRRQILLGAGCVVSMFAVGNMAGTYLANYATTQMDYSKNLVLFVGVLGGLFAIASTAVSAVLCDTVGRRRLILVGVATVIPWSLAVIPLIDTGDPALYGLAIVGTYAVIGFSAGPLASFIPELFATRYRYTGAALSYNLGGILGGAVPPMIAAALLHSTGSWAIGVMMALSGLLSFGCAVLLRETMGKTLTFRDAVVVQDDSLSRLRCGDQGGHGRAGFGVGRRRTQRYTDGYLRSRRRSAHLELPSGRERLRLDRGQTDVTPFDASRQARLRNAHPVVRDSQ